jgi:hypothetical protein
VLGRRINVGKNMLSIQFKKEKRRENINLRVQRDSGNSSIDQIEKISTARTHAPYAQTLSQGQK